MDHWLVGWVVWGGETPLEGFYANGPRSGGTFGRSAWSVCGHPVPSISAHRRKSVAPIEEIPSPSAQVPPSTPLPDAPGCCAETRDSAPGTATPRHKAPNPSEAEITSRSVILMQIPVGRLACSGPSSGYICQMGATCPQNRENLRSRGTLCPYQASRRAEGDITTPEGDRSELPTGWARRHQHGVSTVLH